MKLRTIIASIATLSAWLPSQAAEPNMGVISFENSGAPAAQTDFITGLAALHNFQYPLAARAFKRAQAADPDFALAYWGEAMSYNHAVWHEQDPVAVLQRHDGPAALMEQVVIHDCGVGGASDVVKTIHVDSPGCEPLQCARAETKSRKWSACLRPSVALAKW